MERLVFTAGILLILLSTNLEVIGGAEQRLSRPGCPEKCGDITVPYPFGVGEGCYYGDDDTFSITCNQSSHPSPKPIYGDNLEVQDIHLQYSQIRISNYVSRACFNSSGGPGYNNQPWISSVKFTINTTSNTFAATGCDTIGLFLGTRSEDGMYRYTYCYVGAENYHLSDEIFLFF